jgi:photosynthetic reaction center H subunit
MNPWPGSALVPTGDAMADGVGPAAYAERAKEPELDQHGKPMFVPTRAADFDVAKPSRDPRGFEVQGLDGKPAGKVTDIWAGRAEGDVRFLEVDVGGGTVLLPIAFAKIDLDKPRVTVAAITAEQFGKVPRLSSKDVVTKDEEERIQAYYGGGYLYATPKRAEPIV